MTMLLDGFTTLGHQKRSALLPSTTTLAQGNGLSNLRIVAKRASFSVNVDSSDNIYAFGMVDPTSGGDNAPFICKFSSAGALTYQHHFDAPDSGLYGLGATGDLVVNSSDNPIVAVEGSSTRTYLFFVNEELTDNSSDLTLSTLTTSDGGSISSATYTST